MESASHVNFTARTRAPRMLTRCFYANKSHQTVLINRIIAKGTRTHRPVALPPKLQGGRMGATLQNRAILYKCAQVTIGLRVIHGSKRQKLFELITVQQVKHRMWSCTEMTTLDNLRIST